MELHNFFCKKFYFSKIILVIKTNYRVLTAVSLGMLLNYNIRNENTYYYLACMQL